ncbi:hypothetical protein POTOM_061350 [Populus tomentosa]|uniref:Glutathione S-transferase n=1 Tax=Populus tomentosa TaxID=118781 RepID=A0A8X8BYE9_POPTO|nr:hypothetical protein POTOM_061350 [Populus tomentosa]
MNPVYKKILVLIHEGKPICESLIIIQYIDEFWKHKAPLFPSDPCERAHARFCADYVDKHLLWARKGERQAAKKSLVESFRALEGELGDKPYFGGESFGLIDIALIPFFSFFYAFETLGRFSMEEECPEIMWHGLRDAQKGKLFQSHVLDGEEVQQGKEGRLRWLRELMGGDEKKWGNNDGSGLAVCGGVVA